MLSNLTHYGRIGCASQLVDSKWLPRFFFHTFSMALYHKWNVKNAFAYVLQITGSLGSVYADYQLTLLTNFFFKTCIGKLLFNHTNEFQTMLTPFPEKKNNIIGINKALSRKNTEYTEYYLVIFLIVPQESMGMACIRYRTLFQYKPDPRPSF